VWLGCSVTAPQFLAHSCPLAAHASRHAHQSSHAMSSKSDWVTTRLDEIRSAAFRLSQSERASEDVKRKASFGLLDSKQQTAQKKYVYKRYDAIYDTIWLRFVYLSQSAFRVTKDQEAQGSFIRVSAIALEVRQGIFDLLDIMSKIKLALGGNLMDVSRVEWTTKSLQRIYGLTQMLEKLMELASEIKIRLAQKQENALGSKAASSKDGLRSVPQEAKKQHLSTLPGFVDAPIILLEERLKHYSSFDREALFTLVPQLKDARNSLTILYTLQCDDCAVSLALADTLGEGYFRLLQSAAMREEFTPNLLAAFHAARAIVWTLLRQDHDVDLTETAHAASKQQTTKASPSSGSVRFDPIKTQQSSSSLLAAEASPSSPTGASSPSGASQPPTFSFQPIQKPAGAAPAENSLDALTPSGGASNIAATVSPALSNSSSYAFVPASSPPPLLSSAKTSASSGPPPLPTSTSSSSASSNGPPQLLSATLMHQGSELGASSPRLSPTSAIDPLVSPVSSTSSSSAQFSPEPAAVNSTSAPATASPTATAAVKDEWIEARSGDHIFYYNPRTNVSSWTKPEPSPVVVAPSPASPAPILRALASEEGEEEEEEIVAASPRTISPVLAITPKVGGAAGGLKTCAIADCSALRFPGKPYCVAHVSSGPQ
jgi:hypothetical protein